jgi:hypothetical protein
MQAATRRIGTMGHAEAAVGEAETAPLLAGFYQRVALRWLLYDVYYH